MKHERALPFNIDVESLLNEILEYMEDRQDADHDGDGFVPNKEMSLAVEIRQALFQIEKGNKFDFVHKEVDKMFKDIKPLTALHQGFVLPNEVTLTTDKGVYHLNLTKTY